MTESTGSVSSIPFEDTWDPSFDHTVGKINENTWIKIVDLDGKELGYNEEGEILVKGPVVTMGYLDNPKATAEVFGKDGYLRTGDLGKVLPI